MILTGKYNQATVHAKTVESACLTQIKDYLNHEASKDAIIHVMPDTHAGKGCVIGLTQTIHNHLTPNLVGVDIGCGMLTLTLKDKIDVKEFIAHCKRIPVGFQIHKQQIDFDLSKLHCPLPSVDYALNSLGSLGGGNHFIELNEANDQQYIVIHTGSRNLGIQVCQYHQPKKDILGCISGARMQDYLEDMHICQAYASCNRQVIAKLLAFDYVDSFETVHNYISFEDMILRKGAIAASQGKRVLIPMNMRDGSIIGIGKGNQAWNYSAPHGAGRALSRSQAKKEISLQQFQEAMQGIYSETVGLSTIDESPFAYKNTHEILDQIGETVDITTHLKVLANFKGV